MYKLPINQIDMYYDTDNLLEYYDTDNLLGMFLHKNWL